MKALFSDLLVDFIGLVDFIDFIENDIPEKSSTFPV